MVADEGAADRDGDHARRRGRQLVLRHAADRAPARAADGSAGPQPQGLAPAAAHPERPECAWASRCATCSTPTASPIRWRPGPRRSRASARDLDDALRREEALAVGSRTPEQRQYLADSLAQFWDALGSRCSRWRAADARPRRARRSGSRCRPARRRSRRRWRGCSSKTTRARRPRPDGCRPSTRRSSGRSRVFLAATLAAIAVTSLYLIRSNRRLFARLAALSDERREVAQQLITARESTLRHLARELHDEFGQTLTAMGSHAEPRRAGRRRPIRRSDRSYVKSPKSRSACSSRSAACRRPCTRPSSRRSDSTAPSTGTCRSVERQTGLEIVYERTGPPVPVDVTDRHARVPHPAGGAEQRRAALRIAAGVGAAAHLGDRARARRRGSRRRHAAEHPRARPRADDHARARRAGRRHHRVDAAPGRRARSCGSAFR